MIRFLLLLFIVTSFASGEKVAVLTFDDSIKSHYTVVRPILKKLDFNATFFITEGWDFKTNKTAYMTWDEIKQLHLDGFEIGNHTRDHMGVTQKSIPRLKEQLEYIAQQCEKVGIPKPISFAYPGNRYHIDAFDIFKDLGFKFARRGNYPKLPKLNNIGFMFEPGVDHPYLIPCSGIAIPSWDLKDFKDALIQQNPTQIPILQFHGVPDEPHPWVNTSKENFIKFMDHLKKENYKVIALKDLSTYLKNKTTPPNPLKIIETRKQSIQP